MLLTAILAYAHVLSAMGWLGGGILFGFFVGPRLRTMSPAATREFFDKIAPGVIRFFQATAGLTILFGLLLYWQMVSTGQGAYGPSTAWGLSLSLGILTALIAFVIAEFVTAPSMKKMVALNRTDPSTPGVNLAVELPAAARRSAMFTMVTAVLLLITLGFMIGAGFY